MTRKMNRDDRFGGAEIECAKCGTANPPDRVFCNSCGAKLPLARDPFADAPRPSRTKPILKAVSHLLTIAVIVVIVMVFLPPERIGMDGNSRHSEIFERKSREMNEAIDENRSLAVVVNEVEINGFLYTRMNEYLEEHRFDSGAVLQNVRIMLTPERIAVQTRTKHGPVSLTRTVRGVPAIRDNHFVFDVEKVSVGILPLPAPIDAVVAKRIAGTFSRMEPEARVVENLSRIDLSEGKMRLTVE